VAYATLEALARKGKVTAEQLQDAAKKLHIDPNKPAPTQSLATEASEH
jgi:pyruvate dehydrogenase complex dehydrogenase (E1) component